MSEEAALPAPEAPAPEATAPPKRKAPLTPAQWHEIRTKAETGVARVGQLAKEYGITSQAVSQHLKDHKIVCGSKVAEVKSAVIAATATAIAEKVSAFAEARQVRIEKTREFYYKGHEYLDGLILKKINECVTAVPPRKISDLGPELKALQFAKRSLLIGRQERFAVLDAENQIDVAALPELVVTDLTNEEIEAIQRGDDEDDMEDLLAEVDEAGAAIVETVS